MTPQERKKASIDLSLTYLNSYYEDWRFAKVLTIEKILSEKYEFYKDFAPQIAQFGDKDGFATIAQEIHHGLYFDAIAHCVQYVEDLFALIKAAEKPDYFIRNIITYKAGEVTNFIKSFKINPKTASKVYHFPFDIKFTEAMNQEAFDEGVNNLVKLTEEIIAFYKGYEFIYNQYKHGLTVAMRPFGNIFTADQVEADRKGDFTPYLAVYDNLNLHAASKKGSFNSSHGVFMPGFTTNVQPFIPDLSKENNFLRFVFPPDLANFSIGLLIDNAKKTRSCIKTFIANYSREISNTLGERQFQLPADYVHNKSYTCSYRTEEE